MRKKYSARKMLVETSLQPIAIVEAFSDITDNRRIQGKRHKIAICLASFTLAVAAGNQGFIAIGDWLKAYQGDFRGIALEEIKTVCFNPHSAG